jgi:adenylosuccinate lyase
VHEAIRRHSVAASRRVKEDGADNDLVQRIREDALFARIHADLDALLDPRTFVGRAPEQVMAFLQSEVAVALEPYAGRLAGGQQLRV